MLDVDGVLVNGRPSDDKHWQTDLMADLAIEPSVLQRVFFRPYWQEIVTGAREIEPCLETCLKQAGTKVTAKEFIEYWFQNDSALDGSVLSHVDQFRSQGLTVFLATNQENARMDYLMHDLGLSAHVDGAVWSGLVKATKPNAAFFAAAAAITGLPADQHLLVDDLAENFDAAKVAGWNAELYNARNV